MWTGKLAVCAAAAVLGVAGMAVAAPVLIPIANHSFDDDGLPAPGGATWGGSPSGWTGGGFIELSNTVGLSGGDGPNYYGKDDWEGGSLDQTLTGYTLQPDTTYVLTVAYAQRWGTPSGHVALFAGDSEVFRVSMSSLTSAFADFSSSYTTGSSGLPTGTLSVRVFADSGRSQFDNVRLTADAVPEPASLGLIGLAGLGMLRRRRA